MMLTSLNLLPALSPFIEKSMGQLLFLIYINDENTNIVTRVPEGRVYSPLLFHSYTSEVFPILGNKLIGYADDSTLLSVAPSTGVRVQ